MKEFDYKAYVADNWLLKEAIEHKPATAADLKGFATKDATLARQKRAQKGNWEGSVGKYVEDHRAEIDAAAQHGNLRAYIVSTMKPALSPEAQEYVDKLLAGYASSRQLHQALYNILLKGNGLGLHEEAGAKDAYFNRQRRAAQGNWKGWMQQSVESPNSITSEGNLYRWVEANCNNLDDVLRLNPKELQEPVSVAKEEGLSPREFIEDWVAEYGDWVDIAEMLGLKVVKGFKTDKERYLFKEAGEEGSAEEFAELLTDLLSNCNAPMKIDNMRIYPGSAMYSGGRIAVKFPDGQRFFLGFDDEGATDNPVLRYDSKSGYWEKVSDQDAAPYCDWNNFKKLVVTLFDIGEIDY